LLERKGAVKTARFPQNPIIYPHMDDRMGDDINGPSLIRVPEWLPNPLGRYHLYFAHHQGTYIRLAYADRLEGPWTTYAPGTLRLEQTPCRGHIASPDVHIDEEHKRLIMYYHGPVDPDKARANPALTSRFPILGGQRSFVATSSDGIHFHSSTEVLGSSYFRVWKWGDRVYALGMPGIFYRSEDGFTRFEQGPTLFTPDMRHTAVKSDGDRLSIFYSNAHDCPERILLSKIDLTPDWLTWRASEAVTVLEPQVSYEGVDLPLEPSERGWAPQPVRQLRDPGIYCEGERTYLLYSVAGERGIAIAEITNG
jgi:hypothetical protein